jgi:phage terminase large subunit GpA-like protein
MPIKKLFLDELDAYPLEIKGEGSPIDLAVKRTESYSRNRSIGYLSTPTMTHNSKIKEFYEKGDQRKFFVPCPYCEEMQELVFYQSDGGEYNKKMGKVINNITTRPYGIYFNSEE